MLDKSGPHALNSPKAFLPLLAACVLLNACSGNAPTVSPVTHRETANIETPDTTTLSPSSTPTLEPEPVFWSWALIDSSRLVAFSTEGEVNPLADITEFDPNDFSLIRVNDERGLAYFVAGGKDQLYLLTPTQAIPVPVHFSHRNPPWLGHSQYYGWLGAQFMNGFYWDNVELIDLEDGSIVKELSNVSLMRFSDDGFSIRFAKFENADDAYGSYDIYNLDLRTGSETILSSSKDSRFLFANEFGDIFLNTRQGEAVSIDGRTATFHVDLHKEQATLVDNYIVTGELTCETNCVYQAVPVFGGEPFTYRVPQKLPDVPIGISSRMYAGNQLLVSPNPTAREMLFLSPDGGAARLSRGSLLTPPGDYMIAFPSPSTYQIYDLEANLSLTTFPASGVSFYSLLAANVYLQQRGEVEPTLQAQLESLGVSRGDNPDFSSFLSDSSSVYMGYAGCEVEIFLSDSDCKTQGFFLTEVAGESIISWVFLPGTAGLIKLPEFGCTATLLSDGSILCASTDPNGQVYHYDPVTEKRDPLLQGNDIRLAIGGVSVTGVSFLP